MKIAIINFTYGKKTGIENVADNILKQIDKTDLNNEYILFVNERVKDYYITSRILKKEVKIANRQILKTFWLLFLYPLYSLIKGIDITIIFSGTSNFALSPFTKNIIYIHDLGELFIKAKYDRKRMLYRKYLTLPVNKKFGDIFIAVSKFTQNAIVEKLKIEPHKVKLIYNGAEERMSKLDKNTARKSVLEKYGIKETDRIILTVGRIDPIGKNLIRLIEAIDVIHSTYEDFHLFLVGDSNFPNSHLVPEEIKKRSLDRFITLTGYVEIDELNIFYNASDLLVFPSVHEGFGLPLLEAMKCDLPVACSDIEVFHEVAGDAALYFNPYDAVDIAGKIAFSLNEKTFGEDLVKKGKKRQTFFTWQQSAKELIKILETLKNNS